MFHVRKVHCDEELYYFLYSIWNLFSFGEIFSKNEYIYKELQFLFFNDRCRRDIVYLHYRNLLLGIFFCITYHNVTSKFMERKKRA